jgi:hypothetical protein
MPWSTLRLTTGPQGNTCVSGVYSQAAAQRLELVGFVSDSPHRQNHYLPPDMPDQERDLRTLAAVTLLRDLPVSTLDRDRMTSNEVFNAMRVADTLTDLRAIADHVIEKGGNAPVRDFEILASQLRDRMADLAPADVAERAARTIDRLTNEVHDALGELCAIPSTLPAMAQEVARSQTGTAQNARSATGQNTSPSSVPPAPPPSPPGRAH